MGPRPFPATSQGLLSRLPPEWAVSGRGAAAQGKECARRDGVAGLPCPQRRSRLTHAEQDSEASWGLWGPWRASPGRVPASAAKLSGPPPASVPPSPPARRQRSCHVGQPWAPVPGGGTEVRPGRPQSGPAWLGPHPPSSPLWGGPHKLSFPVLPAGRRLPNHCGPLVRPQTRPLVWPLQPACVHTHTHASTLTHTYPLQPLTLPHSSSIHWTLRFGHVPPALRQGPRPGGWAGRTRQTVNFVPLEFTFWWRKKKEK